MWPQDEKNEIESKKFSQVGTWDFHHSRLPNGYMWASFNSGYKQIEDRNFGLLTETRRKRRKQKERKKEK
jgi:hypothetical protein